MERFYGYPFYILKMKQAQLQSDARPIHDYGKDGGGT